MPVAKSLLSSLSSLSGGSKAPGSEAAARLDPVSDYEVGRGGEDPARDRTHRYYELNDTWALKSDATVDEEAMRIATAEPGSMAAPENGIMRTVAFGQAVTTTPAPHEPSME